VSHSDSAIAGRIQGITGPIIGPFGGKWPEIAPDALIAPGAVVIDAAVVESGEILARNSQHYMRLAKRYLSGNP